MQLALDELPVISRLANDLCGIILDDSKGYLIESRLSTVAETAGCKSFSELYSRIRYDRDKQLTTEFIDAITTNETLFFRDTSPFEAMRHKAIPNLIDARTSNGASPRLRIWSAACSTGQEPYSIAMVLRDLIPDVDDWNITIYATDISDKALGQASRGVYSQLEIGRGLTDETLTRFFSKSGNEWQVRDELRSMVSFSKMNLLQPFTIPTPLDVVFCRNVAIYFEESVRCDIFRRIATALSKDGYLFVGSSESLQNVGFTPQHHCRSVFYQPGLEVGV